MWWSERSKEEAWTSERNIEGWRSWLLLGFSGSTRLRETGVTESWQQDSCKITYTALLCVCCGR